MLEKFESIPYKSTINMKSTMPMKSHLEATVGDTKVYYLEFILYKGLKIYNLTGVTDVTITFKKADGNTVIGLVNILDAENGKIGYLMGSQEVAYAGKLVATIELYGADGERITSPEIQFDVKEQLDNGNAIISTTEYGVLTTLMTEENIRVTQENERNTNEQLRILTEQNRGQLFNEKLTTADNLNSELADRVIIIDGKIVQVNNKLSESDLKIVEVETTKTNLVSTVDQKILEVDSTLSNKTLEVNNKIIEFNGNEVTRQDNFTQMLRTSNFNFRPPVNTLSVLSSTYPSPQIGWCVQILNDAGNTGRIYRWSGTSWEWVLTLSDNVYSALISSPKYIWVEEKTVTSGNKTLTLTNTVVNGQRLQIFDKKYGAKWNKVDHWNISGQTITFLSSMPETLTFEIMNLG